MDQTAEEKHNLYGFNLLWILTEVVGAVLIVAVAIWTLNVRGGVSWTSNPSLMFNWHPLLMTIGLVFLYANGTIKILYSHNHIFICNLLFYHFN